MNYYAYEVLEDAVADGRLCDFLLAAPGYRCVKGNRDYPVFNDFAGAAAALNDYAAAHPAFLPQLQDALTDCLNVGKAGVAVCLTAIFLEQARLEQRHENTIAILTPERCEALREVILKNRAFLENYREFEGEDYENGMYGAILDWCAQFASISDYRIL